MSSNSSPIVPLLLAAVTAVAVAVGISQLGLQSQTTASVSTSVPAKPRWTATAQGRVEPRSGEIKLGALSPGRIEHVLVAVNDKVAAGDLLVVTEDADALARALAADAEAGVRKRERDGETNVPKLAQDRRTAEDRLNATERAIASARHVLDRLLIQRHSKPDSVTAEQISLARRSLEEATARLTADREALRLAQIVNGVPLPTRLEAGLTASRSDLTLAEAALERTRIRAPFDGTVLQVSASVGETAAVTPEAPLIVIGDLSRLRVRAEVEERDAAKVRAGQAVVLKTDAFPGQEFTGRVSTVANAMRPPRLAQKGPRRPNDLDTLEVMVDVDPGSSLMPGMRVDAFFKADGEAPEVPRAATPSPAAKAEAEMVGGPAKKAN
ncbi:MAG: HlyD family secretion protein [Hyphomicrobiaceae bacterium]